MLFKETLDGVVVRGLALWPHSKKVPGWGLSVPSVQILHASVGFPQVLSLPPKV